MKVLSVLCIPVLLSSCALIQMPARLINQVIGPLTDAGTPGAAESIHAIAVRSTAPVEDPRDHCHHCGEGVVCRSHPEPKAGHTPQALR